jgi:hypothetical protein
MMPVSPEEGIMGSATHCCLKAGEHTPVLPYGFADSLIIIVVVDPPLPLSGNSIFSFG